MLNKATGEPVTGFEEKDFVIRDNGKVRVLSSFLAGAGLTPLKVLFLIETAGAQLKSVDGLIESLPLAVRSLRPQDAVGIGSVFPGHRVFLEPTVERTGLPEALRRVQAHQRAYVEEKRQKFSFDDLNRALVALSKQYSDLSGSHRLVIVIVTDDFDLLSPGASADAAKSLLQDGTTVAAFVDNQNPGIAMANKLFHTVRFGTPLRLAYRDRGASYFAQQTGGPVVTVRNGNYSEAVRSLLRTFSSSYLIGFQPPDRDLDGKFHKLAISVNRKEFEGKIKIVSRHGYWAIR